MPTSMNCPGCRTTLRLREDWAGLTIKCPRCGKVIALPAGEAELVEEVAAEDAVLSEAIPVRGKIRYKTTRPCPECGEPIAASANNCLHCKASLYKPCPRCGEEGATRVLWTPWGSSYGPALFAHVRCPVCGHAYNGRSGRSNLVPVLLFVAATVLLILAIIGALGLFVLYRRRHLEAQLQHGLAELILGQIFSPVQLIRSLLILAA